MSELKFNAKYIIERAVEEGVQYGIMRTFMPVSNQVSQSFLIFLGESCFLMRVQNNPVGFGYCADKAITKRVR